MRTIGKIEIMRAEEVYFVSKSLFPFFFPFFSSLSLFFLFLYFLLFPSFFLSFLLFSSLLLYSKVRNYRKPDLTSCKPKLAVTGKDGIFRKNIKDLTYLQDGILKTQINLVPISFLWYLKIRIDQTDIIHSPDHPNDYEN